MKDMRTGFTHPVMRFVYTPSKSSIFMQSYLHM